MKKLLAIAAILSIALLSGCSADSSGNQTTTNTIQADGCIPLVIATSSEKVGLMTDLGSAFKNSPEAATLGKCVTVYPQNVASGAGATALTSNPTEWQLSGDSNQDTWPTIWSPASSVWTQRVEGVVGNRAFTDPTSFMKTPVVFGMPETMAKALGWPDKDISIKDIGKMISTPNAWDAMGMAGWGSFKIAKTNPNTSTTGLSVLLMQSYAYANKGSKDLTITAKDVQAAKEFNRKFELGAIHYGDTTGGVLSTLASSNGNYVSAVALEETSIYNYNLGNPDSHVVQPGEKLTPPSEKLVAVYPSEGSLWSDNPAVILNNSWVTQEKKDAAEAFMKFLNTDTAQKIVPQHGFRPNDSNVDISATLNATVGIDPKKPTITLKSPGTDVVSAAIDQWQEIRKPSSVLELVDISGSMKDPTVDGSTKIEGATKGVVSTLQNFRQTDEVGIWAFTNHDSDPSGLGKNIVELRKMSPMGSDLESLTTKLPGLISGQQMNGTPMYDAVSQAYDYMLSKSESGRINAIVLLSDGDDKNSTSTLDSLLLKLNSSAKEGQSSNPVRIFTIAYGKDANTKILKQIATASGGQAFDATDPTKIQEVITKVIHNF